MPTLWIPPGRTSWQLEYQAAKTTRHRKTKSMTVRSEDLELNGGDRDSMVAESLNQWRNNSVMKAITRLRALDVVGAGIEPQPESDDDAFARTVLALWEEWCIAPDVTGRRSMREVQSMIATMPLAFGDGLVIFVDDGTLQLVEGTSIGKRVGEYVTSEADPHVMGVDVDGANRHLRYWVGQRVLSIIRNPQPVDAEDCVYIGKPGRVTTVRSIPEVHSVLDDLQDLLEYDQIEMIATKVSASLTAFVQRTGAPEVGRLRRTDPNSTDEDDQLEKLEPGSIEYLEPGETIASIASNRPNTNGIDYVLYRLRKIGGALGIPAEFILMQLADASFSASQALFLQYQQTIEGEQEWLISILNRIYRRKLIQWYGEGRIGIPADGKLFAVRWQPPTFRWVNKASEVQADMQYLKAGALTLDDVTGRFGYTARTQLQRKAKNISEAMRVVEELNASLPVGVAPLTWRDLFDPYQTNVSASSLPPASPVAGGTEPAAPAT